jgi:NAD(P)-dependent dehydrogenase (short-subunit alcohol dehydrogenase family)
MSRLRNKVAFISGGASGIGRAIVERFAKEGAAVFFGDMHAGNGEAVAKATGATFVRQDVSREEDWIAAMSLVEKRSGRLDVVVNNAGILGTGALETIDVKAWDRLFAVNVTGVMLGCKHGGLFMQRNPGGACGSIINMSSNAALLATADDCGYSATKGAVRLMTKSIAVNFARRGFAIRCNSIHPGPIDTPIFDSIKASATQEQIDGLTAALQRMVPMGRIGRADEIAALALFLATDESSFSTGSEFVADGGGTAALPGL